MKGFCECGHPSRPNCEGHTINTCQFKYQRKLQDWSNRMASSRKYVQLYREHLWANDKHGFNSPEFNFLVGVEALQHLMEDILNHERKAHGMPIISKQSVCTCSDCVNADNPNHNRWNPNEHTVGGICQCGQLHEKKP